MTATKQPYRGEAKGAYRPEEIAIRYGIGRTSVFAEMKAKRLLARKFGSATIILHDDAESWARALPTVSS